MSGLHGLIYAYNSPPELGDLVAKRTGSSIPFGARYRLIDFTLSSMMNAGVRNVGLIMNRDYQSLLDHVGSGAEWDMSRRDGGLKLLPPFGLAGGRASYGSCLEALSSVASYIAKIRADNVVIAWGDFAGSVDISAMYRRHVDSAAGLTVCCSDRSPDCRHYRYTESGAGLAGRLIESGPGEGEGLASHELYIAKTELLRRFIDRRLRREDLHLHRDMLPEYLSEGGRLAIYVHPAPGRHILSVDDYYEASMKLLKPEHRVKVFPPDRPVRTKERADASTYYGERAEVADCLLADGCLIAGSVSGSILFRGVQIGRGAKVEDSILLQDTVIAPGARLSCVIADKNVRVTAGVTLSGTPEAPLLLKKNTVV